MGLETPTFISDLTPTNPVSNDPKGQGDDHIRNLKTALKNTFPNASKAHYLPSTQAKTADFAVVSTDMNKTFLVDTTAGVVTATLPSLASGDAGWECSFIKTNTGTNTMYIAPPAGTIQSGEVSGLAKTRRCIPGHRTKVLWTGTAWIAERVVREPVGACIEFHGTSLPVGYEWPNGQSLNVTNYPDYASVRGSGTTADRRGRVAAGKDDMGGASANRLTNQSGGLNGDTFEAAGGAETHTLVTAELATHTHTITDTHKHNVTAGFTGVGGGGTLAAGATAVQNVDILSSLTAAGSITANNAGSGTAHNNVQPTIIENFILVVE